MMLRHCCPLFSESGDQYVSPFHDISLYANDDRTVCNMIVEVPRWTNAKMEVWKSILEPVVTL